MWGSSGYCVEDDLELDEEQYLGDCLCELCIYSSTIFLFLVSKTTIFIMI